MWGVAILGGAVAARGCCVPHPTRTIALSAGFLHFNFPLCKSKHATHYETCRPPRTSHRLLHQLRRWPVRHSSLLRCFQCHCKKGTVW